METQQDPQQQQQLLQQQTLHEDGSTGSSSKSSFLCRQTSTRWTPTTDQIRILKDLYYNNGVRSPSGEQIQRISARLRQYGKIEGKNVFYWFQNHKARERQKKRFTVDMAMQRSGAASSLTFSPTGFSTPSSPSSSPGVLGVGQMGSMGCGSVLMEKSFRDCTISSSGSGMGGSISSNMGWVGVDPYSSSYPFYDKMKSIQTFKEETPEIETLPLFPMHGENISGFCTGNPDPNGYNTSSYRPDEEKDSTRTSLELSLNSYTGRSPYTD